MFFYCSLSCCLHAVYLFSRLDGWRSDLCNNCSLGGICTCKSPRRFLYGPSRGSIGIGVAASFSMVHSYVTSLITFFDCLAVYALLCTLGEGWTIVVHSGAWGYVKASVHYRLALFRNHIHDDHCHCRASSAEQTVHPACETLATASNSVCTHLVLSAGLPNVSNLFVSK